LAVSGHPSRWSCPARGSCRLRQHPSHGPLQPSSLAAKFGNTWSRYLLQVLGLPEMRLVLPDEEERSVTTSARPCTGCETDAVTDVRRSLPDTRREVAWAARIPRPHAADCLSLFEGP